MEKCFIMKSSVFYGYIQGLLIAGIFAHILANMRSQIVQLKARFSDGLFQIGKKGEGSENLVGFLYVVYSCFPDANESACN